MSGRGLTSADERAIRDQMEKYRRAALAADWDAWGATLAENVVISPAGTAPQRGRAAAVAWGEGFPPLEKFTVDIEEIDGEGDFACVRGTYELEMTTPDGGRFGERGMFLDVHRRTADGSWPYTHAMFHSIEPAQG